jgi:hypothetical protein
MAQTKTLTDSTRKRHKKEDSETTAIGIKHRILATFIKKKFNFNHLKNISHTDQFWFHRLL